MPCPSQSKGNYILKFQLCHWCLEHDKCILLDIFLILSQISNSDLLPAYIKSVSQYTLSHKYYLLLMQINKKSRRIDTTVLRGVTNIHQRTKHFFQKRDTVEKELQLQFSGWQQVITVWAHISIKWESLAAQVAN